MARVGVNTRFDCGHILDLRVRLDDDVAVPEQVRGLGKCSDCMKAAGKLIPITGVQPQPDGNLILDSIFMMPLEEPSA